MSNLESNAILISAALNGFRDAQKETNICLKNIENKMEEVVRILGEHDTRLVVHDIHIEAIQKKQETQHTDTESQIKIIKKRLTSIVIVASISIVLSSTALAETSGYKMPILTILANILKSL